METRLLQESWLEILNEKDVESLTFYINLDNFIQQPSTLAASRVKVQKTTHLALRLQLS